MLRINHRFVVSDDRIHILKEHDPGQHRMREARLSGFFMMLTKIARCMKELSGHDRSLESPLRRGVEDRFSPGPGRSIILQRMIESLARRFQACVATLK